MLMTKSKLACVSAYMSSGKSSKEGDLSLCIMQKKKILCEAILRHLVHQSAFKLLSNF